MNKASDFGKRIARIMLEVSSSHVFFLIQQAYREEPLGENMSWDDAVEILKEVIGEPEENKGLEERIITRLNTMQEQLERKIMIWS